MDENKKELGGYKREEELEEEKGEKEGRKRKNGAGKEVNRI